ncbi:MAG: LysM domain-containing protein [Planctomycetota bacterium]|nr:LysM domain-containing protein [Planctomycetota bacterium]
MPSRAKPRRRRPEPASSSLEALKPMLVLGLLGMILYGAYTVVQQGKGDSIPEEAPAFAAADGLSAPVVDMPAAAPPAVVSNPEPTYLNAISAPPPAAGDVPSQTVPVVPPPFPSAPPAAAAAMAAAPTAGVAGATAASAESDGPTVAGQMPALPPVAVATTTLDPEAVPGQPLTPASMADGQPSLPPAPLAVGGQPSAFASAWSDAHDKLTSGRYAEALAVLSAWYDDPTLGLEESQRLEDLLGQLAGTVIYSQEDLLLPPHIVAPGENLQSIAMTVGVPWQLLGKINGVDDAASLLPGEALKMVRGPFDAVVSVSRRRLSLQLGGNYAGSFPVVIGRRVQERVGASLAVAEVRREAARQATAVAAQVSYLEQSGSAGPSIVLSDGLRIEASDDPLAMSDEAPEASLIISARDLAELIDILGPGSSVLIRQ